MAKTLKQIEERLSAIQGDIESRGSELTIDEITAFDNEVALLKEERNGLKDTAEKRQKLLDNIADGVEPSMAIHMLPKSNQEAETRSIDKFDTVEYRSAFMKYVTNGTQIPTEYRASTSVADVGVIIPTVVLNKVVDKLESTGMILPLVTRTSYKGGLSIPKSSVKPTASWVASGAGSTIQKMDTSGTVTFNYHKLRCAVAVTLEVEVMSLSAFESKLISNIVEAMTKAIEQSIIDGDGIGKPKGILAEDANEDQVISVDVINYTTLTEAEGALPQAYENNAVWCMSKKTFMSCIGMLDSTGQPIARVNYGIDGKPERRLLGREVICCDYITTFKSDLAVDTPFAFLFDFKDYALNTNYETTLSKYKDEVNDDTVTKAIMLVDGKVIDNNSLVVLKKKG